PYHSQRIAGQLAGFAEGGRDRRKRTVLLAGVIGRGLAGDKAHADQPARLAVPAFAGGRGELQCKALAVALDVQHAAATAFTQLLHQRRNLVSAFHALAVDGEDAVARLQHAVGGGVFQNRIDQRRLQPELPDEAGLYRDIALIETLRQL